MKRFLISFLITAIVLVGVIFYFQYEVMDLLHFAIGGSLEPGERYTAEDGREELVVLLMGIDRDPDRDIENQGIPMIKEKAEEVEGKLRGEQYFRTGNRSDTIYLGKFNKRTGEVVLVSIPRDTLTSITYRGEEDKINAAMSWDGPYGALETVRNLTGVDVEYMVVFDYDVVREMVDILGGVEVEVPFAMQYDDPTDNPPLHIDLQPGLQTLNGKEAIGFCRWRHNNDYSVQYNRGDVDRVDTQQYFMKQFVKEALKAKNLPKVYRLADAVFKSAYTNLPKVEIFSAGAAIPRLDLDAMRTETIPGDNAYINGISYFLPDQGGIQTLVEDIFADHLINR